MMRLQLTKRWRAILAATMACAAIQGVWAQETGSQIVEEALIRTDGDCHQLTVRFVLPVTYLRHSPLHEGKDLFIRLELTALTGNDRETKLERRAISLSSMGETPLVALIYEGDVIGGPLLALHYNKKQRYWIHQGEDFRSVVIEFSNPQNDCGGNKDSQPK